MDYQKEKEVFENLSNDAQNLAENLEIEHKNPEESAAEMPEQNPPEIKPEKIVLNPPETSKAQEYAKMKSLIDQFGNAFDTSLHKVDRKSGLPKLTKTGKLWLLDGMHKIQFQKQEAEKLKLVGAQANTQREAEQSATLNTEAVKADNIKAEADPIKKKLKNDAIAKHTATAFFGLGKAFHGEAFEPRNNQEREAVKLGFSEYYATKGDFDLPPWLELSLVLGGYWGNHTETIQEQKKKEPFFKRLFSRKKKSATQPKKEESKNA